MKKYTKGFISVLLSVVMLLTTLSVSVFAAEPISGICGDNLTWTFDTETAELSIEGNGAMYDYDSYNRPWESHEDDIQSVVVGNSVTTIGSSAFYDCNSLKSVTIGSSVTTIGDKAFYNCDSLKSVTIPDNVTTIGFAVFYTCDSLTSVTIGNGVSAIGDKVFEYCDSLASIEIDADNEYYSSDSFRVLYNKDRTMLIKYPTGNERTEFTIPDSVTAIGELAFSHCDTLTSVTIGNSVTTIGDYAFFYCKKLASVKIPDSVTTIEEEAFAYCDGLTSVTIGNSVNTIGHYAFLCCTSLTSIEADADNENYSSDSFGVLYNKDKTELIQYPIGNERISFTISDSVTIIGENAFAYCDSLTNVTIPDSVTTIGHGVFASCTSLKSVTIPNSVITIGDSAFEDCKNLVTATIPDSVTTIGAWMFESCTSLKSVTIGNRVTAIGSYAFAYCDSLTDVYYRGSESQWASLEIDESNTVFETATVHYNYGKPSGTLGENINWSFDEEDGALLITGNGEMLNLASAEDYGWYYFKDKIETVEFANGITSVGDNAFYGYPKLKEVYLGQTVEKVGANAFEDCSSLAIVTSYALNFIAQENSFGNNDDRFIFLHHSSNAQAADYSADQGLNHIPVYYDYEKKVLHYNGEITVYQDLPYLFLSKFIKQNPDTEYLYFDKIAFHGVETETFDIEEIENDAQAKYLTFNKLYVSLKKVKDGSAEGVTFDAFLTLLENGDYDSFMFELVSEEGNQLLTIVEVIEQVVGQFITNALRVTSKIINFFRKIFK